MSTVERTPAVVGARDGAGGEPSRQRALEAIARIATVELMGLDLLTWARFAYESGSIAQHERAR